MIVWINTTRLTGEAVCVENVMGCIICVAETIQNARDICSRRGWVVMN